MWTLKCIYIYIYCIYFLLYICNLCSPQKSLNSDMIGSLLNLLLINHFISHGDEGGSGDHLLEWEKGYYIWPFHLDLLSPIWTLSPYYGYIQVFPVNYIPSLDTAEGLLQMVQKCMVQGLFLQILRDQISLGLGSTWGFCLLYVHSNMSARKWKFL